MSEVWPPEPDVDLAEAAQTRMRASPRSLLPSLRAPLYQVSVSVYIILRISLKFCYVSAFIESFSGSGLFAGSGFRLYFYC